MSINKVITPMTNVLTHPRTENQLLLSTKRNYRKPSEQLFSYRRPLSYQNASKCMETYIRCKQQKKQKTKHDRMGTMISYTN